MIPLTKDLRSWWLKPNNFYLNVAVLVGGTAVSQLLGILFTPVLSRLYTPADFGLFAVFNSTLSFLAVLASLRYELAIPLPKENADAFNLTVFVIVVIIIISTLVGIIGGVLGNVILRLLHLLVLKPYLWLLPISLVGAGIYQVLNYWRTRNEDFTLLSYTKSLQVATQLIVQAGSAILVSGPLGLILGFIAGQLVGCILLARRMQQFWHWIAPRQWRALALIYRGFPLYSSWATFINVLGDSAPSILFTTYFSLNIAGFFAMSVRILSLPASLVGQAVSQAFYPKIAKSIDDQASMQKLIEKLTTFLFFISYVIFGLAALHGASLFAMIFGDQWRIAGQFAQYMVPWLMFAFISSPLSTVSMATGHQKENIGFSLVLTGMRVGTIWFGAYQTSALLAVALFSFGSALIYIVYLGWILRLVGSSLGHWLRKIQLPVISGLLLLLLLFGVSLEVELLLALPCSIVVLGMFFIWVWRNYIVES